MSGEVKRVKPPGQQGQLAGGLTPATTDVAEGFGKRPQGSVLDAVCGYGKLRVSRVQRRYQPAPEWTKTTTAATFAAAGVRATTVWAVRGSGRAVDGRVRLAGVRRVRR